MKIDFYMGPEFLRTKQKTNPFFDPIIEICDENEIEWRVLFSKKPKECGYPKGRIGSFSGLITSGKWFWRIVHLFAPSIPSWKVYRCFGRIARLFLRKDTVDLRITISGWLNAIGPTLYPHKRIVDIQHGVIFSTHHGYFESDGRLKEIHRTNPSREFWLYGQGYVDCFFRHPDNVRDLAGRVKVVGDLQYHIASECVSNLDKIVVISLQPPTDLTIKQRRCYYLQLRDFLTEYYNQTKPPRCLMKNHPRSSGAPELDKLLHDFPLVHMTKEPWDVLYPQMALHVTVSSTVTLDCALSGIPTYLIKRPESYPVAYYKEEYCYPFYDVSWQKLLILGLRHDREMVKQLVQWFARFYESFDERYCLELLKGN